jgi:uncharacterized protein (DUF2141 family)
VVDLEGLKTKNGGGEVSLYIYTKENMHKVGRELRKITKDVTGSEMKVVIDSIPAGNYGVTCFQDIDRNKKLKTNFLGFPKEPVGLSNNPKVRFGPPSFKRAKITIEAGKTLKIGITLK